MDLNSDFICGRNLFKICGKLFSLRALVSCALGFECFGALFATASLFSEKLSGCTQVAVCLCNAICCGCLVAVLLSADSAEDASMHRLRDHGSFGAGLTCAMAGISVSAAGALSAGVSLCKAKAAEGRNSSEAKPEVLGNSAVSEMSTSADSEPEGREV
ncbi:unnamed protein product [Effrenium voratum]|nr:unnamed protein product [Effrenium voratum]